MYARAIATRRLSAGLGGVLGDSGEQRPSQLRPADQQVGQVRVGLVVVQRGSVDPGAVQARGLGDADGRGRVPFPLTARVDVGVGVSADAPPSPSRRPSPSVIRPRRRSRVATASTNAGGLLPLTRRCGACRASFAVHRVAVVVTGIHGAQRRLRDRCRGDAPDRVPTARRAPPSREWPGMPYSLEPSSGSMIHTRGTLQPGPDRRRIPRRGPRRRVAPRRACRE